MRVLSIDPGFERVGISVIEKIRGERERLVYSSCFKTKPGILFSKRLLQIGDELEKIIKKHKPNDLAIETLFFNTNQKTAIRVGEACGVVLFVSKKMGLKVYEYAPLQVKIATTGYGKASKSQVAAMIPRLISLENKAKKIDDEIDAIAIGLTHCSHSTPVEK